MKRFLFSLLLLGCSAPEVPDVLNADNTRRATALVWEGVYGLEKVEFPSPSVSWLEGGRCLPPELPGAPAGCYDGLYDPGKNAATCLWEGLYARSALAHELFHAYLAATSWDGDPDVGHRNRGWGYWVPEAEAALKASGIGR